MTDLTQVGRIAFRQEGNLWNAYYALPDTMEDAIHLRSSHSFARLIDLAQTKRKAGEMPTE